MTVHFSRTVASLAFLFSATLISSVGALAQMQSPTTADGQTEVPTLAVSPSATIAAADASSPAVHTGVRIVRLSQVKGGVLLDRNVDEGGSQSFENAFANLPITQGATLKTTDGVAEVELEDNSSIRLTPDTTVLFTELRREPSGFTASSVKVLQGTVFVSLAPTRGNQFSLTSTEGRFTVAPDSRVHFHEGSPRTTVAVLDGSVQAQVGETITTAGRKTTLSFEPNSPATPTLVSHLDKNPYDSWDKQAVDYHKHYMNTAAFGSSYGGSGSPIFGLNDMNYYGAFSDAGGCGNMWRPYLASAVWSPYGNGVLAYYPSSGYSWVSPYPWGWMPFHSGSWVNCPGAGWGWQPGGTYNGLTNLNALALQKHGITVPPPPPRTGHGRLLAVNTQPLRTSGFADQGTFVFNKDSAGLGVPRETFGKLGGISRGAIEHGMVSTAAYSSPAMGRGVQASGIHNNVSFARAGSNPSVGSASAGSRGGFSGASSGPASSTASLSAGSAHSAGGGGASSGGGSAHH